MDAHSVVATAQQVDSIQLLNNVNAFYNQAWDKLVLVITLSVAIVGIAVPVFLSILQKKTFDSEVKELERRISKKQTELIAGVKQRQEKIERDSAQSLAGVYHVQTIFMKTQGRYANAIGSGLDAIMSYLKCKHTQGFRAILTVVIECLAEMNSR